MLDAAEKENYCGYSKFDALNSPFLHKLSLGHKWLRLLFIQAIKECPVNLRPILAVEKSRNPKGIALFARAYFLLYEKTKEVQYLRHGEDLVQWLLKNHSPGRGNLCWGYNFVWQSTLFLQDKYEPNLVVSVFVGESLVHAYRLTGNKKYLEAACSVGNFITRDLPVLYESEQELAVSYVPEKAGAIVLNNQVLAGAFLAKIWNETGDDMWRDFALRMMTFTVGKKTPYHAWYYTYPERKSHISHDNYHTGGVLDGLLEYYEETGDGRFMEIYWKGLEYYRSHLFERDGAPKWMNDKTYPYDIHGAAQGVISFKKASKHDATCFLQARKIAHWAINHLYRPEKREFFYRKGRFFKWNYSLMRWCNAWMARALAEMIS